MMKAELINCFTWYANRISETTTYTNWSDNFAREEVMKCSKKFLNALKNYIDFENLTEREARELRFQKWSEDEPDLYLIPLYLLPILPIGIELACLDGEKLIYDGKNVDDDIRCGCIAYGIRVKRKK